ncbi:hypothetical protein RclHR1_03700014 [Rhizophagus clarus]|uniref:Uncharacterized protein n=1 Tax=Rhizophagus clarus TaxID=94130 RepID=A0A2Z6S6W1_9GLOM|nr:hypothetical protein RclHR1_03700014 [Rhizophagus clarus]GES72652.1 hypothetical protein GLOIN_2v1485334 [Rhizophagus clarus]
MSLYTEINVNNVQEELRGEELNLFNKASACFNEPDHLSEEVPAKYIINIIIQPKPPATTDASKVKGLLRLGGLGGTNMEQTEDGLNYEGIKYLAVKTVCQRESTISKLFQSLLEKRIILVRSPPMTGKTNSYTTTRI